jgi:hypothetical protein
VFGESGFRVQNHIAINISYQDFFKWAVFVGYKYGILDIGNEFYMYQLSNT